LGLKLWFIFVFQKALGKTGHPAPLLATMSRVFKLPPDPGEEKARKIQRHIVMDSFKWKIVLAFLFVQVINLS
jgi:hypothetical protein